MIHDENKARAVEWLKVCEAGCCKGSLELYWEAVSNFLQYIGEKPLSTVNTVDIAHWLVSLKRDDDRSNNGARFLLGRVKSFLLYLEDEGTIPPRQILWRRIPRIPKVLPDMACFTEDEYRRTLAVARNPEPLPKIASKGPGPQPFKPWISSLLVVGWNTGARISDAAGLRWEDVDFEAGTVTLHPQKRKRVGQTIVLPMTEELRAELERLRAGQNGSPFPHVLPEAAGYYGDRRLRGWLHALCGRAGLSPKHRFHSLRHGFATRLLNNGVDSLTVSAMTGQSLMVLQRYVHVSLDAKRAALNAYAPSPKR
ncbi:MAG: tyrosine-type recombinase/integrase [Candidatus Hydrogenedentales bacterium]|jgi:integrase